MGTGDGAGVGEGVGVVTAARVGVEFDAGEEVGARVMGVELRLGSALGQGLGLGLK